jgi:hypothetical protein
MRSTLTFRLIGAIAALIATGGCAVGRRISPEAFRRGMPLAIVTVSSSPQIMYSETHVVATGIGMGGPDMRGTGFKAGEAKAVLPATKAAVVRALSHTRQFQIVSEETVLSSAAYASAPAGPLNVWTKSLVAAKGYKLVFDEERAGRIARALGASGALFVSLDHHYTTQGVPGGRIAGNVHVMLTAVDRSGRIIWTDYTHQLSERTLDSSSLRVPIPTLEPLLADSAERGTRTLLARLDEQLRGAR